MLMQQSHINKPKWLTMSQIVAETDINGNSNNGLMVNRNILPVTGLYSSTIYLSDTKSFTLEQLQNCKQKILYFFYLCKILNFFVFQGYHTLVISCI